MSITKTTDYDKFNRILNDVWEKDLTIGIARANTDNSILVAVSTNNREIIRSRTYDLTESGVSDILNGINILRNEINHAKKNRYQNEARSTS